MTTYFDEIKRYVGFDEHDSAALRSLLPSVEPEFDRIADHFYECVEKHPGAASALEGPAQVARLKRTLVDWMRTAFSGPHDEAYFERRCRIGRVHVRINLPQRYMFTAMNVIRLDLRAVVDRVHAGDPDTGRRVNAALDKLLDLELAIMLETYREDSEDRLRRKERLVTIGRLAGNVAHDLRNPLGVIESSLFILMKHGVSDPKTARHLNKISAQVQMCGGIITNLLELARQRSANRQRVEAASVVAHALKLANVPERITVETDFEDGATLNVDPGLFAQALANLISNAVAAYEGRPGRVVVHMSDDEDDRHRIEVADDGPGFDPEVITRVFEPLVTTRKQGIGLGLALVKDVVDQHGGKVTAGNREEGGALVRIELPVRGAA